MKIFRHFAWLVCLILLCLTAKPSSAATPAIAFGAYHTVTLKADGTVWVCGLNTFGQYGNGAQAAESPNTNGSVFSQISTDELGATFSNVTAIAAGDYYTVALKSDGTVWTWGANFNGELGNNTPPPGEEQPVPVRLRPGRIIGLNETGGNPVIAIGAGRYTGLALKADGTLWTWGLALGSGVINLTANQVYQTGGLPLTGVVKISSGKYHALALKSDGTLWAWGENSSGQLGDGTNVTRPNPVLVTRNGLPFLGMAGFNAGNFRSYAWKSDGTLWGWGDNYSGTLGAGSLLSNPVLQPVALPSFGSANPVTDVSDIDDHTLVRVSNGNVWSWGWNYNGQLGYGPVSASVALPMGTPTKVPSLSNINNVDGNQFVSAAIDSNGNLWTWGSNKFGIVGHNPTRLADQLVPISYDENGTALPPMKKISTNLNSYITMSLGTNGTVWTWGSGYNGSLGDGTYLDATQPIVVPSLGAITDISSGGGFSLALDSTGSVWAWGRYRYTSNSSTPTIAAGPVRVQTSALANLSGITSISAGVSHALARSSSGTVWAWGKNDNGNVGNGTTTVAPDAVQVTTDINGATFNNVAQVSAMWGSMARKNDGTVWTWGNATSQTRPKQTSLSAPAVDVSGGLSYWLALDNLGRVWGWGLNQYGQVAPNAAWNQVTPIQVAGLTGTFIAIRAGEAYSMALRSDGTVWAWGSMYNYAGVTVPSAPFQVPGYQGISGLGGALWGSVVRFDGSIATWGSNTIGEVGSGGFSMLPEPTLVGGLNFLGGEPSVSISAPANNSTVSYGTAVTISVSATTPGASLARVDYYYEGVWIGSSSVGQSGFPNLTWTPRTWGTYKLRARAVASNGKISNFSSDIVISVPYSTFDSDGDGMPNWWESANGLNPSVNDESGNPDGDGLTNYQEWLNGTNPQSSDTDGDGMSDSYEVVKGLKATQYDAMEDPDGDGVPNIFEFKHGWNPVVYGRVSDPNNPVSVPPRDFIVDSSFSADNPTTRQYKSIRNALSALNGFPASDDYAVVDIRQGSYSEDTIFVQKPALLLGAPGLNPVQITSSVTDSPVFNVKKTAVLSGLWIRQRPGVSGSNGFAIFFEMIGGGNFEQRLINCIVSGYNLTSSYSAIYNSNSRVVIVNCTFFDNKSLSAGNSFGGYSSGGYGKLDIINSIIWDINAKNAQPEISFTSSAVTVKSSFIYNGGSFGAFTGDPRLNPSGLLTAFSPARSTGDPFSAPVTDIQGESRIGGGGVDIGADEFVDSDSDNLPDNYEISKFAGISAQTGNGDYDSDRLINQFEYDMGFDPISAATNPYGQGDLFDALSNTSNLAYPIGWLLDRDDDGLSDGWELFYGTNPATGDANGDGIFDGASIAGGINPTNTDLDGDGISNSDELAKGLSPFTSDSDGDGVADNIDAFPLDSTRSTAPTGSAGDTTPPSISLSQPVGATPL